ncbi:MAG: hypothetical protein ABW250_13410 [Pyrinomonadaceae bacterium]
MSEPDHLPKPPPEFFQAQFSKRSQVIDSVRSPLGFCALVLLIVEAFLIGTIAFIPEMRVVAFFVGIFLFLLVFGTVVWLVVKHPTNLIFGERSQLEWQAMQMYGQRGAPITSAELQALPVIKATAVDLPQLQESEREPKE